jgi:hypothetical protein
MAQNNYFSHDDTPIGRTWSQRISDCGYNHGTWIGENIAAGYSSAASVFEGWKNSPGHNSNMLSTNFTAIGIGRYQGGGTFGVYWTTAFGGYDDGWMNASDVIDPLDQQPLAPDAESHASSSVAIAPSGSPSGGRTSHRRLDFSPACRALQERKSPLAALFCR